MGRDGWGGTLLGRWSGMAFLIRAHLSRGLNKSWDDLWSSSSDQGNRKCKGPGVRMCLARSGGIMEAVVNAAATGREVVSQR